VHPATLLARPISAVLEQSPAHLLDAAA
jgi:hypothetical protein